MVHKSWKSPNDLKMHTVDTKKSLVLFFLLRARNRGSAYPPKFGRIITTAANYSFPKSKCTLWFYLRWTRPSCTNLPVKLLASQSAFVLTCLCCHNFWNDPQCTIMLSSACHIHLFFYHEKMYNGVYTIPLSASMTPKVSHDFIFGGSCTAICISSLKLFDNRKQYMMQFVCRVAWKSVGEDEFLIVMVRVDKNIVRTCHC